MVALSNALFTLAALVALSEALLSKIFVKKIRDRLLALWISIEHLDSAFQIHRIIRKLGNRLVSIKWLVAGIGTGLLILPITSYTYSTYKRDESIIVNTIDHISERQHIFRNYMFFKEEIIVIDGEKSCVDDPKRIKWLFRGMKKEQKNLINLQKNMLSLNVDQMRQSIMLSGIWTGLIFSLFSMATIYSSITVFGYVLRKIRPRWLELTGFAGALIGLAVFTPLFFWNIAWSVGIYAVDSLIHFSPPAPDSALGPIIVLSIEQTKSDVSGFFLIHSAIRIHINLFIHGYRPAFETLIEIIYLIHISNINLLSGLLNSLHMTIQGRVFEIHYASAFFNWSMMISIFMLGSYLICSGILFALVKIATVRGAVLNALQFVHDHKNGPFVVVAGAIAALALLLRNLS